MSGQTSLQAIEDAAVNFRLRLFKVAAIATSIMMIILMIALGMIQDSLFRTFLPLTIIIPCICTYFLAVKGLERASGIVLVSGVFLAYCGLSIRNPDSLAASSGSLVLIIVVTSFVLGRLSFYLVSAGGAILILVVYLFRDPGALASPTYAMTIQLIAVLLAMVISYVFAKNTEGLQKALRNRLKKLEDSIPDLSDSSEQVSVAASELRQVASDQQKGAIEQERAVKETRESMLQTLVSSRQISDSAQTVLENAQSVLSNSERLALHFSEFSVHTSNISDLAVTIKEIANKSDLLALNAAIEATQAGEQGRGFSLVSTQMQHLSENILDSVRMIEEITGNIHKSTDIVESSIKESTLLAKETTRAAREIFTSTTQQQRSTEQVARAMDDIAQITQTVSSGSKQAMTSTEGLILVAEHIPEIAKDMMAT